MKFIRIKDHRINLENIVSYNGYNTYDTSREDMPLTDCYIIFICDGGMDKSKFYIEFGKDVKARDLALAVLDAAVLVI